MRDTYASLHITRAAETAVAIQNGTQVVLGDNYHRITLSDDGPEGVADLIARMFEALASAPDLQLHERTAVRDRMLQAVAAVEPVAYAVLETPEQVRERTLAEDRTTCPVQTMGGACCTLEDGHEGGHDFPVLVVRGEVTA